MKELTKAVTSFISNSGCLPLPDDLFAIVQAYLERYAAHDESDCQKLHEELQSIYQNHVSDKPSRIAPFLAILRMLMSATSGSTRHLQWWDTLSATVLNHLGEEKGLAAEVRHTLLDLLIYDEDAKGDALVDAATTTSVIAANLLAMWLFKSRTSAIEFDEEAHFVEGQIQLILVAFGKKRPKEFLTTINKFFVLKDSRINVLSLLCEFIRHQPPHLHKLLQTPLFDNLLRCLQIDTSTRVISLAMTALVMFLPHIPSSLATHLPALFNIYTRMLFWDRERRAESPGDAEDDINKAEVVSPLPTSDERWEKLPYLLESEDETVPELLHYFTFLYGLYPINFMSYIRKPQRYLRHANFPGADDLDIQPTEIRQRSEPYRQVHLLHPNFFHMTIESELDDKHRWMRSEAADVVAECMALYAIGDEKRYQERSVSMSGPGPDNIDEPLLDDQGQALNAFPSRHVSWRNTQSTAVTSPLALGSRNSEVNNFALNNRPALNPSGSDRKQSQTSQSIASAADSPSVQSNSGPDTSTDSPVIPAQLTTSVSHTQLQDLLNTRKPARGSVYQALTSDSVHSLSLNKQDSSTNVDAYIASLAREPSARSPSLHPAKGTAESRIAYLHREIMLLRNDLNFERYLKQQHLSHIGQLRRKQIREARVEAETQNLINTNRGVKNRLEEAKRSIAQIKRESDMSKTHSRKWEADLTAKLRVLREEQKKWIADRDQLTADLGAAKDDNAHLRRLVMESEARELNSTQKVQNIESSLNELESLRSEVEKLTMSVRLYEAGEHDAQKLKESEEAASSETAILRMTLASRDAEVADSTRILREDVDALNEKLQIAEEEKRSRGITKEMLDNALKSNRNRIAEMQKAHNHLLNRYTVLHQSYLELSEQNDPPLSGTISPRGKLPYDDIYRNQDRARASTPPDHQPQRRRSHAPSSSDPDHGSLPKGNASSGAGHNFPAHFRKPDVASWTPLTSTESLNPTTKGGMPLPSHHGSSQRSHSSGRTGSVPTIETAGLESAKKAMAKQQSEVRNFGRGMFLFLLYCSSCDMLCQDSRGILDIH